MCLNVTGYRIYWNCFQWHLLYKLEIFIAFISHLINTFHTLLAVSGLSFLQYSSIWPSRAIPTTPEIKFIIETFKILNLELKLLIVIHKSLLLWTFAFIFKIRSTLKCRNAFVFYFILNSFLFWCGPKIAHFKTEKAVLFHFRFKEEISKILHNFSVRTCNLSSNLIQL